MHVCVGFILFAAAKINQEIIIKTNKTEAGEPQLRSMYQYVN